MPGMNISADQVELRKSWLDFFLSCVKDVSPDFKIGTPNMSYVPIQLHNGRRNALSLWCARDGVRIAFNLDSKLDAEGALIKAGLPVEYNKSSGHLTTRVSGQPEGEIATMLRPLAIDAARKALSGQGNGEGR